MFNENDLNEQIVQTINPYDTAYPITLLSNAINRNLEEAQLVAQNIYKAVAKEMPVLTQVKQAMNKGCKYVVDMSENTKEAIDAGVLKLTQENGKTYAQIRENGKYGKKLPIKKKALKTT